MYWGKTQGKLSDLRTRPEAAGDRRASRQSPDHISRLLSAGRITRLYGSMLRSSGGLQAFQHLQSVIQIVFMPGTGYAH